MKRTLARRRGDARGRSPLEPFRSSLWKRLEGTRGLGEIAIAVFFIILSLIAIGCGRESPSENYPEKIPGALSAVHFPTADGCSWEYTLVGREYVYKAEISGTRSVGGVAARLLKNDSNVPVDHFGSLYGIPIRTSFFTKDLESYTELAFELEFMGSTLFLRNSPKRVLWSFPLYKDKEWVVSKSRTIPEITYTRKVVSDNNLLTVTAGNFKDVYYVEEYISAPDIQPGQELVSRYWIAPDVGVVKYDYLDIITGTVNAYELSNFKRGR